jgi:hypothetical protein
MTDSYIKKNIRLSLEFDNYIARHPSLYDKIPHGAYIVITVKGDDKFNEDSVSIVRGRRVKNAVEAHKTDSRWTIKPLKLQTA